MRVWNLPVSIACISALLASWSCGDPATKAGETASACGRRECPSGTRPEETRSLDASNDISGGYDPATYKAEGSFKRSGSGSCEYACVVIQPCPNGTFPIIGEDCFTCGNIKEDGTVDQGACSDEGLVATECGKQLCPTGTGVVEKRSIEGGKGYDVSQGFDPATFDPDQKAYLTFDKGECEYACTPLQACPDGTFPIITNDCFTCGAIIGDEIKQAVCRGVDSSGAPEPTGEGGTGSTEPQGESGAPSTPAGGQGGAAASEEPGAGAGGR
jgi:hypothetical protein